MAFISPGAASNLVADGAYVYQVPAPPQLTPGPTSNVLAIIGAFTDGKPNTPIPISTQGGTAAMLAAVGDGIVSKAIMANSGVREALSAMPETTQFLFMRVTDGTEVAATCNLVDNTGFATENIVITTNAGTGQTIALAFVNGSTTVNVPATGSYAVPTGQTPAATATALAALINNSAAVLGANAFLQPVVPSAGTIPVYALASGTGGNSITIAVTVTGTGQAATPSTATALSGGAAPGTLVTFTAVNAGTNANGMTARADLISGSTSAAPVYNITVNYPYNPTQVWRNIAGSASGGAFSATAFTANVLAAVNGTAPGSVASPVVVATAGASTSPPLTGANNTASGGTNGGALTSSMFIGTDGASGRKGMYALRGQSFNGLLFAGVTDPTVASSISSFLAQVGGVGFVAFPSGTSTTTAISTKNSNNISYPRIIPCMDWDYYPDILTSQSSVLLSPLGGIAGIVMSINPWDDPSNKPDGATKGGILATERTISTALPVDPQSEGAQRKTNGIMYITNGMPRTGGRYGLPHGLASDGSNISDTRMFDYVAARVLTVLSRYVGRGQTPLPSAGGIDTDPTRRACNADLEALKQDLINPTGVGGQKLAAFRYVNVSTPSQIAAGYLVYQIFGTTIAGIQFALGQISVGTTVS